MIDSDFELLNEIRSLLRHGRGRASCEELNRLIDQLIRRIPDGEGNGYPTGKLEVVRDWGERVFGCAPLLWERGVENLRAEAINYCDGVQYAIALHRQMLRGQTT